MWDCRPLEREAWPNILGFDDGSGDGHTLVMRQWIKTTPSLRLMNPLPIYRPALAPLPPFYANGGTRRCYVPTEHDAEAVRRHFPELTNPHNPAWQQVAARLVALGHPRADLERCSPPELLALLDAVSVNQDAKGDTVHKRNHSSAGERSPGTDAKLGPRGLNRGEIVFHENRVELCGVDICSGPRCRTRRVVLELLSQRREDGSFIAYSSKSLETEAKRHGAKGSAVAWIRDLRAAIAEAVRKNQTIDVDPRELLLSGGAGYRLSDRLNVRFVDQPLIKDIKDTRDMTARDISPELHVINVPNVSNADSGAVPDAGSKKRRDWIVQQLKDGVRLKAAAVAAQFRCSTKTAMRDLAALRHEGKIEFDGARRTGCYRMRRPSSAHD
jgi:hypothetical protein